VIYIGYPLENAKHSKVDPVHRHPDPVSALVLALALVNYWTQIAERIVVFSSHSLSSFSRQMDVFFVANGAYNYATKTCYYQ
jgi:hypothetical protein